MKEKIVNRLITIRSIVTLTLLLAFVAGCITEQVTSLPINSNLVEIFKMVTIFYFGAQLGEMKNAIGKNV